MKWFGGWGITKWAWGGNIFSLPQQKNRERTKQEKNTFRPAACRQVPDISAEFQGIYEIHQQLLRKVLKVEIEGKGNNYYYPTQR